MATDSEVLPNGWVWTTLGEIADLVGGGTPSREVPEFFTGGIIWLTPTEIPKDRVALVSDSRERITDDALRLSSAKLVPKGTVLMTSRASIGYVAVAGSEVTTNQGFASFICSDAVYNFYLAYWLWANAETFKEHATGTTFKEITKSKLRPFIFPLAPRAEQERIVAEIETQFTRLDAGVAALKRAQANLKRYKAAVLKAACEGALVPQNPSDEPASALLARILAARRAKWEADLRAKGKNPATARCDDPAAPNTDDLPALPDGWCWALWEQLSPRVTVGHVGPTVDEYVAEGIPFLRSQNVRENRYEPDGLRYISPRFHAALSKSTLHPGDLVVVRSGSVGITCVIPESLGEANCADLVIVQRSNALDSLYGAYYMNSLAKRQVKMGQVGVALIHFNTKSVAALPIAVPPLPEQERIVAEVERRLSVVQEQETVIAHSLTRAERLRQAILAQAFAGNLVPQNPTEESARLLLERMGNDKESRAGRRRQH